MRIYFHTRRRKIGLVTLILACVFLCGWARSRTYSDGMEFDGGKRTRVHLESENGFLLLTRITEDIDHDPFFPRWTTALAPDPDLVRLHYVDEPGIWRWGCFTIGSHEFPTLGKTMDSVKLWLISYMSLVIPLTLLSAALLLIRPRPTKSTIAEARPTPEVA